MTFFPFSVYKNVDGLLLKLGRLDTRILRTNIFKTFELIDDVSPIVVQSSRFDLIFTELYVASAIFQRQVRRYNEIVYNIANL